MTTPAPTPRSRRARRALFGLVALAVLVASTAACSTFPGPRWRKVNGLEYRVAFVIPLSNPERNAPPDQWFVDAVYEAGAKWDAHPDVTVEVYTATAPENDWCKFLHDAWQTDNNCVETWEVPNAHMTSAHGGAAGVSVSLTDGTYLYNGNAGDPARIEVPNDWSMWENPEVNRRNAVCHEMGHALGLGHANRVDLDGDPATGPDGKEFQPTGPCNQATPDRDTTPNDGLDRGYDWQEIAAGYPVCVNDPHGPWGIHRDPYGTNDLTSGGYEDCGAGAAGIAAADAEDRGPLVRVVESDSPEDLGLVRD